MSAELLGDGPPRESDEARACDARGCWWNVGMQKWDTHDRGCPYNPRRESLKEVPKSRRTGRIVDTETSRREAEQMGETALNDSRLTPCMRYCYLQMAARWYKAGSVFVVATPGWLADRSEDRFTPKQCKLAITQLRLLGYMDLVKWSRVKKKDPGLYDYIKGSRVGTRGTWPAVYHMRQDLPERDTVPDEENPLLQMAAAV